MMTWRSESERIIKEALTEAEVCGLDRDATIRLVDSRYPFGERKHHPYKIWLDVRRKLVTGRDDLTRPIVLWELPKEDVQP